MEVFAVFPRLHISVVCVLLLCGPIRITKEEPHPKSIHPQAKMPVILPTEHYDRWLDPGIHAVESVLALLMPYDASVVG